MDHSRNISSSIFGDNARIHQGDIINNHTNADDEARQCAKDLRITDPRDDKTRIEQSKGGLLQDSYCWVLTHVDHLRWRDDPESRLLWIKGDPGKGKTMLLCGIINEMKKTTTTGPMLAYFFCQATDNRINSALAVVRGLIYMLIDQKNSLLSYVQRRYKHAGKKLFEDPNAWVVLSDILKDMLDDPGAENVVLIIDALDECVKSLPQLLHLIIELSASRTKCIVSSRNWLNVQELDIAMQKITLHLELNENSISDAVQKYVEHQVRKLTQLKKYDAKTRDAVLQHLVSNSNNTFLWVSLVCQALRDWKLRRWNTLTELKGMFPAELDTLYERMMEHIYMLDYADLCKSILATACTVYRPVNLRELASLISSLDDYKDDLESLKEFIQACGSFLTIQEDAVYFVHQSAKDFLLEKTSHQIFRSSIGHQHYELFSRSLSVLSRDLRRNIYLLKSPGTLIDEITRPEPDPLRCFEYCCIYWVDHLQDSGLAVKRRYLRVYGDIYKFLKRYLLNWLEALSLGHNMSKGVAAMETLVRLVGPLVLQARTTAKRVESFPVLFEDARRFVRYHRMAIEKAPLQVYSSAVIFSPARSIVKRLFKAEVSNFVVSQSSMEEDWSACIQTLECRDSIWSLAFGAANRLAFGCSNGTVELWDTFGSHLHTFRHSDVTVESVVFAADSQRLASLSHGLVKIWDVLDGKCLRTFDCTPGANSIAFRADCHELIISSETGIIAIWDLVTGERLQRFLCRGDLIEGLKQYTAPVFSADGNRIARVLVSDHGHRVETYNIPRRRTQPFGDSELRSDFTIDCGKGSTNVLVALSADGVQLAVHYSGVQVRIFDTTKKYCIETLPLGHRLTSLTFANNNWLAGKSVDGPFRIWNAGDGLVTTIKAMGGEQWECSSSPDRCLLATLGKPGASVDIWDIFFNSSAIWGYGPQLAALTKRRGIHILDLQTGKTLAELENSSISSVSLDPHVTFRLWTKNGNFELVPDYIRDTMLPGSDPVYFYGVPYSEPVLGGYRIDPARMWVMKGSERLLWIPPEYRNDCCTTWGRIVEITPESGGSIVITFSET
ncbi:Fc.00g067590.m01.CDS01 [Cosmosporella sp. VM-42]